MDFFIIYINVESNLRGLNHVDLGKRVQTVYRASTFTRINGNVSCICDKRLQNLHIV